MNVSTLTRTLALLALTTLLAACGGGGGSDSDSGFNPPGMTISATPSTTGINTNSAVSITVRVTQAGGAPINNGTQVTGTVSPASAGSLAAVGEGTAGNTATAPTSGGTATFLFQSGNQPTTATLTFSAADPNVAGRNVTTTAQVTIASGPSNDPRVTFQSSASSLPANPFFEQGYTPFYGSPYVAEVTVTARSASGQAIVGEDTLNVSINPVEAAVISTLDDPSTPDQNEFQSLSGSFPLGTSAGGQATVFVHSSFTPGPATLSVSFTDPDTGQVVTGQYVINIASSAPPLPANVEVGPSGRPVYVVGSGGPTFTTFSVRVEDGSGEEVPDPVSGNTAFNNVRLEIIGDGVAAGEQLSGVNAQGQNVEGTSINLRTNNGVAGATFRAGSRTGTTVIRATADRADNNVDNGITDPVVGEGSIVISDGRLFSLEITSPSVSAIAVNPVSPLVEADGDELAVPPNPDGTYSLTVAAIATDRQGNPVLPGTVINFGLIDEPQVVGVGDFQIAGGDGNPQEAGTLFTAPGGAFQTAGGGAGPGDTLALFGEESDGNRDHESTRRIANINSQTSLNVTRRFNRNDDTGSIVDRGAVIPYVIGRATDGNVVAQGVTNELGVARTIMNYPVSQLGKRIVLWAQGDGAVFNGTPETVADVEIASFPGIAPATLVASPNAIPANGTSHVSVCVYDALGAPITRAYVGFGFEGMSGNGSVNGVSGSGVVPLSTGADGCLDATVVTSGVTEGDGEPVLVFTFGDASDEVTLTFSDLILQASPTVLGGTGGTVTLTLRNGSGAPMPGFQLSGSCETDTEGAAVGISSGPGTTNAQGQTTAVIFASNLNQLDEAGTATCTFETADGSATVEVTLNGTNICENFSPPNPACAGGDGGVAVLQVGFIAGSANGNITSVPAGINCTRTGGNQSGQCVLNTTADNAVLTATPAAGTCFAGWTGTFCTDTDATISVPLSENFDDVCAAEFSPDDDADAETVECN